jgi:hypothetical protein
MTTYRGKVFKVARVSQFVKDYNLYSGHCMEKMMYKVATNKSGTASDKYTPQDNTLP